MSVTEADVYAAREVFRKEPTNNHAAMYLSKLHEAYEGGETCEEDFHDGLHEVERYLWKGGTVKLSDSRSDLRACHDADNTVTAHGTTMPKEAGGGWDGS